MKICYKFLLTAVALCLMTWIAAAQDPIAYYPFTNDASDASGFENHASVNGAHLAQDRFGVANSAFHFDGETNFLSAPNGVHLNTDLATVSFWVNVTEIPGQGEAYLISFGGWQERYKVSLPSHGKLIWTTNADAISDMDAGDGNELQVGVWTHVAMVHDGAQDKIYMNGVLANQKDVAGNLNATDKPLGIGYNIVEPGNYFNGALDEIMIFGEALTDQQIADLYADQSTPPVFGDALVAEYAFSNNLMDGTVFANQAKGTDVKMTTDRFGFGYSAVAFNGTSSHLDIDNSAQLNSPATTVSFWINVGALPGQGEVFVASFGGWQERWKISLPSHGKIVWTTNHTNGISDMDAGDGNELQSGEWKHLVFVHDGAQDKIYMDGAVIATKDVVGDLNATTMPLGLGYSPIDNGLFFDGSLDEVRIYNYALDDQAIADLYAEQSMNPANPTTLVAHYPFAGDANDATQFGNHARVQGATTTVDRFGYGSNAYAFSGAEMIYASNSVQYNSDFTSVSFWVRVGALPDQGEAYLLSFGGWQERWKISLPQHGKPVWTTNNTSGISDMDSGDGNELQVGVWMHAVFTHDGAKDKIYLNGALVAEKDVAGALNSTAYPLGMGFNPIDGGSYFTGDLDDVQIYNVALTDQEVADLYALQNTPPLFNETLVANYPFSRGAYDETPFNNHGWVNGALPAKDRFGRANQAYWFDGVSSNITASNSEQLSSPAATVSFWVNPQSLPGQGEVYLLSYGGWQERFKISLPSHGKPVWTTNNTSGISDMDSGDGNELQVGTWTHAVFVHDGAQDKIYFDGVKVAEKDVAGDLNETVYDLGIGYNIIDNANFFNGFLDEVRLYNVALTDQEIADLYAEQSQAPALADTIAPWAPLDLTGVVTFTDVDLSWCAATDNVGVTGYNVFLDSVPYMATAETSASLSGLDPLTEYTFGVTAVDSAGNESLMTTLQLTTGVDEAPDTIPPTPPGNLMASVGANSIVLSWEPSTDNQAVGGYIVYVDGIFVDSLEANATSILIGGLDPETPYYCEVQAFDLAGNLSEFAELEVTTGPPVVSQEEGLVAWYPFEGDANDATPYNNHGVIGGDPVFEDVTDRPNAAGQAIVFDGDMDSVLAANAVQLISDYTTVSFWIRVDGQSLDDPEAYVLDFGHWDERWKISLPQHLKIVWTTNSKNAQFDHAVSDMDAGDGNELVIGFWWYVTMVHDGDDDIIYLDGVEVNRKPAPGTLNSTGRPFHMASCFCDGLYFQGALDEVKVYNKALTAEEVEKLYTTGTTSIPYIADELKGYVDLLYPNPGSDMITVQHGFSDRQDLLVRVYDQSGRQIDAQEFDRWELQSGQLTWNVADYSAGYYTLNFVYGGKNLGSVPFIRK